MAGKRARDDESLKDDRPDEPGREDEDELLKDDEDNRSTAMEVQTDSTKSRDTLESERQHVDGYALHEHNATNHFKACE